MKFFVKLMIFAGILVVSSTVGVRSAGSGAAASADVIQRFNIAPRTRGFAGLQGRLGGLFDAQQLNPAFQAKLDSFFGDREVYDCFIARLKVQPFYGGTPGQHLARPTDSDSEGEHEHYGQMIAGLRTEEEKEASIAAIRDDIEGQRYHVKYTAALRAYNAQVRTMYDEQYAPQIPGLLARHSARMLAETGGTYVLVFDEFPEYVVKIPKVLWTSRYQMCSRFFVAQKLNALIQEQGLTYIKPVCEYLYKVPHHLFPGLVEGLQAFGSAQEFYPLKRRIKRYLDDIANNIISDANYISVAKNVSSELEGQPSGDLSRFAHVDKLREEILAVIDGASQWDITTENLRFTPDGQAYFLDLEEPGMDNSLFHKRRDKKFFRHYLGEEFDSEDRGHFSRCGKGEFTENFK